MSSEESGKRSLTHSRATLQASESQHTAFSVPASWQVRESWDAVGSPS